MFFNTINVSDVRPGDHLYRYRWFEIQQGIAVRFPKLSPIYVVTTYKNTLILVTLNEFKGRSSLRRVPYEQSTSFLLTTKLSHRRPPEEIVQNAFLLLNWIKTSPDRVQALLANDPSQFARKCCITVHEQWRNLFSSNKELIPLNRHLKNGIENIQFKKKIFIFLSEQVSRKKDAFNAALMCGMPFRQASQIGWEEFRDEKQDQNCSPQSRKSMTNPFFLFKKDNLSCF
jgi:hypothetical protein